MEMQEKRRRTELAAAVRGVPRSRKFWQFLLVSVVFVVLVVLCYAEENYRGPKVWERCRTRLLNQGIQLDWHKLAPPKVTDENNFATTPFFATLFDYEPGTFTPRDLNAYNLVAGFAQFEPPYADARRTTEMIIPMSLGHRINLAEVLRLIEQSKPQTNVTSEKPEQAGQRAETAMPLLAALGRFRSVLDELQNATSRSQARFNLNYGEEYSWAVPQPHLPVLERISRILAWRGCAELAVENAPAAAQDAELIVDLASTLQSEPFRSSFLTRNVMLDNARQVLWEGLARHQWSRNQLSELQTRFERISLRDIQAQLQLDRCAGNGVFEMVHQRPYIVKGWTFGSSLTDKARGFILRNMPSGWMYLEQAEYQNRFDACAVPAFALEQGRVYPKKFVPATPVSFAWWRHRLLADLVLSGSRFLCNKASLAQTGVNQAVIACALERYHIDKGQFPSSLEELSSQGLLNIPPDVITGQPMNYRRTPDGRFVLYSVGWNEQDDDGKTVVDPHTKALDPEQGDWVWPAYPEL
jgi:hypothetical protein